MNDTVTLADLAADLDSQRKVLADAQAAYEKAGAEVKQAVLDERAAYKAFNAAVADMKPKRPRKEKAEPAPAPAPAPAE